MTTEARAQLRKSVFALARLELVIERFERLEALRRARLAGATHRCTNEPIPHSLAKD